LWLILLPFLLGLHSGSAEAWVLTGAGIAALIYSLITNYELGVVRIIPMSVHLALDALSGLFLATSPWLFGFADRVYLPHVFMGMLEMAAAMLTRRVSLHTRAGAV